MKKYLKETFLIFALIIDIRSFSIAQNNIPVKNQDDLERITENSDYAPDFSDFFAELQELREHPLNLNKAKPEDIHRIPYLTSLQETRLREYIEAYGELFSINELNAIEGFDSVIIKKIEPYIRIGKPERHPLDPGHLLKSGKSQLNIGYQQILQKQKGYMATDSMFKVNPNAGYLGTPQKYCFRYRYDYFDRLSFGFSGEKDAGEQFFRGAQKYGMDHYSGYIRLQHIGFLKNLVLGNFNASFGQGLVLGSGISLGALPGSGTSYRNSDGFRSSLSANETSYLRGIAATIRINRFDLSAFYSGHRKDANLKADTLDGREEFTAFLETGDHRTVSEIAGKNTVREQLYGGNVSFRNNYLKIGVTGFRTILSNEIIPIFHPYNQFVLRGNKNQNIGADLLLHLHSCFLFGEWGRSQSGGMAWLAGFQFFPDDRLNISLTGRNYQRNYQDLTGNALGQNSSNANEQGVLLSFAARIHTSMTLSGFVDVYRFPWLKYRTNLASSGTESILLLDYTPDKTVRMQLRFRMKDKQINTSENPDPVTKWMNTRAVYLRYQLEWQASPSCLLKSRIETIWNKNEETGTKRGYLVYQDINFKPPKYPVSLSFRYALFDCDSYDERLYAYENDVPYSYSVPAYDGSGVRTYLLVNWSPFRFLELWIKYSQTWYFNKNTIGTGLEMSEGNTRSEVKVEVVFKF
jgi:hypothetical protein